MFALKQTGSMRKNSHIPINKQTDQLYEPLRQALRNSTLTQGFLSYDTRSSFQRSSASYRKMRFLTPTEAENIKNWIFIPVNKQLVPTRNIQKVLGKQFTPVDVSERVCEPLTPEQFNLKRQGGVSEIVYQIKDDNNPYQLYSHKVKQQSSPRVSKKVISSSFADKIVEKNNVQQLPKPLFMSHSSKDLIPGKQMSISLANGQNDVYQITTGATSPRKYQFKQSLRDSKNIPERYRYNLLNAADQGCVSNCCGGNEIVASNTTRE